MANISASGRATGAVRGSTRGFAAMEENRQRQIASKGGRAAHDRGTAHEFTPDEARAAGRKGGETVSQDRTHMAEIGKKGGATVSRDRAHMSAIGRKGGASASRDREHNSTLAGDGGEGPESAIVTRVRTGLND